MSYFGNPFFQMEFTIYRYFPSLNLSELIDNTTSPQLEMGLSNSTVTATVKFYQIASCLSNQQIRLIIQFQQPIVDILPGSASNEINEAFLIHFEQVPVLCEYLQTMSFQSLVSHTWSDLVTNKRYVISLHQQSVPCYEITNFKSQMDLVGVYILKLWLLLFDKLIFMLLLYIFSLADPILNTGYYGIRTFPIWHFSWHYPDTTPSRHFPRKSTNRMLLAPCWSVTHSQATL